METSVQYQLVLQFPVSSLADYDALISLEQQCQEALTGGADVDGHDMGVGEANIFIVTADPESAFRSLLPVLQGCGRSGDVTAAYREATGDRYHVLWPPNHTGGFNVA